MSHLKSISKWLTDPDAANYPFPYQIGDRLKSPTKNIQGTVRKAKYAGTEQDGPFCIIYYLETDISQITQIPQTELEEIVVS